jgi:hypothetical protein
MSAEVDPGPSTPEPVPGTGRFRNNAWSTLPELRRDFRRELMELVEHRVA